jgi:hypothetical protein
LRGWRSYYRFQGSGEERSPTRKAGPVNIIMCMPDTIPFSSNASASTCPSRSVSVSFPASCAGSPGVAFKFQCDNQFRFFGFFLSAGRARLIFLSRFFVEPIGAGLLSFSFTTSPPSLSLISRSIHCEQYGWKRPIPTVPSNPRQEHSHDESLSRGEKERLDVSVTQPCAPGRAQIWRQHGSLAHSNHRRYQSDPALPGADQPNQSRRVRHS